MIKNRLLYIVTLIVTVWIYIVYVDYSALVLLAMVMCVPLIMLIVTFLATRKVTVSLMAQSAVVTRNSTGNVCICITNPSILPMIGAKVVLGIEHEYEKKKYTKVVCLNLPDREISKYNVKIIPGYCGKIRVSVKKVRLYDFLGLWSYKGKIDKECQFITVPEYKKVNLQVTPQVNEYIEDPVKYSDTEPGDDPSEVFDIREYQQGDKMQRIHWKLSAKLDDIFIKDFSMPIDASAILFADMSMADMANPAAYADAVIEAVFLMSVNFMEQEIFHYISWYNPVSNSVERQEINEESDIWKAMYSIIESGLYSGDAGLKGYERKYAADGAAMFILMTPQQSIIPSCNRYKILRICDDSSVGSNDEHTIYVGIGRVCESISNIGEI